MKTPMACSTFPASIIFSRYIFYLGIVAGFIAVIPLHVFSNPLLASTSLKEANIDENQKKQKGWRILFRDKTDTSNRMLPDTFYVVFESNAYRHKKTIKYTSKNVIYGLVKNKRISYSITVYSNYYKKIKIDKIENYFYRPLIIKMTPIINKVKIMVRAKAQSPNQKDQLFIVDSLRIRKYRFPLTYRVAPFIDNTFWQPLSHTSTITLSNAQKQAVVPTNLIDTITVKRITHEQKFNIKILGVKPPQYSSIFYSVSGFNKNDDIPVRALSRNKLTFEAQWPKKTLVGDNIRVLFTNPHNYFFTPVGYPEEQNKFAERCTLKLNNPEILYTIELKKNFSYDFIYIASYKLENHQKWHDQLNSLLKSINKDQGKYHLFLSNANHPIMSNESKDYKPVLQKILENEYDPPEVAFDVKTCFNTINSYELNPQRQDVRFRFFFTSYIRDKTIEGIVHPVIKKFEPMLSQVKIFIYSPEKIELDFIKTLKAEKRKNVILKTL